MIGKFQLRRMYEDRKDPRRFVADLREQLGLPKNRYDYHRDHNGVPYLKPPTGGTLLRPEEFPLRGLFEAICGEEALGRLDPNQSRGPLNLGALRESGPGPGVDPTAFMNISAFNAAVSGLIEVKLLESYKQPEFIGDKLARTVPTRLNGQKLIGLSAIGDKAKNRKPGMPHPPTGFGERYVQTPETSEQALKCEVLQETVFYDLTGDVLQEAAGVGKSLGIRDEQDAIDSFIGVTTTYNYKGVAYSTYQTSAGTAGGNYQNAFTAPLTDYTTIDAALLAFVSMTDPETGLPISVMPKVVVATPFLSSALDILLRSTQIALVDNRANANTIRTFADVPPRIKQAFGEPLISTWLYYRMIASASDPDHPGLGYASGAGNKAAGTWFIGDPQSGHMKMENWPLRVRSAAPDEYVMLDRGVIAAYFADYRNVYAWTDPRFIQRNTPS